MLITMSDMGVGGLLAGAGHGMHVYGPRGLSVLTSALGTFVNTREIGLQVRCTQTAPHSVPPEHLTAKP